MRDFIEAKWREHIHLFQVLPSLFEGMEALAGRLGEVLGRGGKVLVFGNGGSAASAQHFASELVGRLVKEDALHYPALALTTDSFLLTALANDFGYREVFSRQIEVLGRKGDMALGITTSGRSPNVLKALEVAREMELVTVGLTGGDGLALKVDLEVRVPSHDTPRIQEAHDFILHTVAAAVKLSS